MNRILIFKCPRFVPSGSDLIQLGPDPDTPVTATSPRSPLDLDPGCDVNIVNTGNTEIDDVTNTVQIITSANIVQGIYTAQYKYVCARLLAFFDVLD